MEDKILYSAEKRRKSNWFLQHLISFDLITSFSLIAVLFYIGFSKIDDFTFNAILHIIGISYIVGRTIRNKGRMNIKTGIISSETYMFSILWAWDVRFILIVDILWGFLFISTLQTVYNLCRGECYRVPPPPSQ